MPKKRVGVTLRKPSPAPESAVAAPAAASPSAADAPFERSADSAGELHDVVMTPLSASTAEAFVNGAAAALEKAMSQLPMARLQALIERGREGYRELLVYLPESLAQRLALYCREHDLDMSRLVASAIEAHLDQLAGVARSGADARAPRSARQLVHELAEWVRALWAAKWAARAPRPSAPAEAAS